MVLSPRDVKRIIRICCSRQLLGKEDWTSDFSVFFKRAKKNIPETFFWQDQIKIDNLLSLSQEHHSWPCKNKNQVTMRNKQHIPSSDTLAGSICDTLTGSFATCVLISCKRSVMDNAAYPRNHEQLNLLMARLVDKQTTSRQPSQLVNQIHGWHISIINILLYFEHTYN